MKNLIQKIILVGFIAFVALPGQSYAGSLPETVQAGSETLMLNGEGVRKKLFISLYNAGLYLKQKSKDAEAIIAADDSMAIQLEIVSGFISSEKMEHATREGFDQSTGGDTAAISAEIEQFLEVFKDEIKEGDMYLMNYLPGQGVAVSKNGAESAVVAGLPFKKALFGIWLSSKPVQKNLKKAMLGK